MLTQKCLLTTRYQCRYARETHTDIRGLLRIRWHKQKIHRERTEGKNKSVQAARRWLSIGSIQHEMMAILSGANSSILCLYDPICRATCNAWITHIRRQLLRVAALLVTVSFSMSFISLLSLLTTIVGISRHKYILSNEHYFLLFT